MTSSDISAGQRFLSSAGVDTQSLFRKARDLQTINSTTPLSSTGNDAHSQSFQSGKGLLLNSNSDLYASIEEMRTKTIQSILLNERNKTNQIVQDRIRLRLQESFAKSKASLGNVIEGTGRRVPSIPVGQLPVVDLDNHLIRCHLERRATTGSQVQVLSLDDLETIARENRSLSYLNAICLFKMLAKKGNVRTPHGNVISCLQFLAEQFKTYIVQQVKSSSSSNGTGAGGLLGYIYRYVEIEMGRSVTSQGHIEVMWRVIFYALRCGDFRSVQEVISRVSGQVDPVVSHYIDEVCRITDSVGIEGLRNMNRSHIGSLTELYRRVKSRSNSDKGSQYEVLVLGLLSFSPIDVSAVSSTIEDYIFMELWSIVRSENDCVEKVCTIAENIMHWGANYFEDGTSGSDGWAYSMPLLLCQQFKTSLNHLTTKGGLGLCLAVHLALAIHHSGVEMVDLKSSDIDKNKDLEDITNLIMIFVKSLQTVSPAAALQYLVNIPGNGDSGITLKGSNTVLSKAAQTQICQFLIETKAYPVLAGQLSPDGSRLAGGALDHHFSRADVSDILAVSAEQAISAGRIRDGAELYCLAGRFCELLSILNRQLASLLVTKRIDEREFWRKSAETFYNTYLKNGQCYVVKVLETERKLQLGNNFQILLNLMTFIDRCNEGNWESAWNLIDNIDLIPKDEKDVSTKVESFHSLSSPIQLTFDQIISYSMQALSKQHYKLKHTLLANRQGRNSGIEREMYNLRNRARVLVTFAALIPVTCDEDVKSKILHLEAQMI